MNSEDSENSVNQIFSERQCFRASDLPPAMPASPLAKRSEAARGTGGQADSLIV